MGGGFPAAAFGGRADVMAQLAPAGPVYQAGTLSGNPVATAAGLATLRPAPTSVYARRRRGGRDRRRLRRRRADGGGRRRTACSTPAAVQRLLHRRAPVRRLRRRRAGRTPPRYRGVLPRDARPRRLPAAVARSRRGSSRPRTTTPRSSGSPTRCPRAAPRPRRAAADRRRRAVSERTRRPPAPARRGPQPRRRPLRPAARLPPVRARAADGRRAPPTTCADRDVAARRRRPRWSGPRQTAAPIAAGARPAGRRRRPADRGRATSSRARRSASATARCAHPRHWRHLRNPFRPSWGEPYTRVAARMLAAVERRRATPPAGTRPCCVSHQLPIWIARLLASSTGACGTTRASGSARWPRVTSLHLRRATGWSSRRLRRAGRRPAARPRTRCRGMMRARRRGLRRAGCSPPSCRSPALRRRLHRHDGAPASPARATAGDGTLTLLAPDQRQGPGRLCGHDGRRAAPSTSPTTAATSSSLNVWGSWCAPCQAEAPALQAASQPLRRRRRAVPRHQHARDAGPAAAQAFQRTYGITYPSLSTRTATTCSRCAAWSPPTRSRRPSSLDRAGPRRRPVQRADHDDHARRPRRRRRWPSRRCTP